MALSPARPAILSVSALTRLVRDTLASTFPAIWVRGEVGGFKRAESGHLYFSLKEGRQALVECVMYRLQAQRLRFEPKDGTEVEAFGSISVYEPRGKYQLAIEDMRPSGLGALLLAQEELKRRLAAEGLFDAARKKPLPRYPLRIGIVTSPAGAAFHDLVKVLLARWRSLQLVLAPVRVQGEGAAAEIAAAIGRFNRYAKVDLLVVGRGGGSLEDLWAFNEEVVVRAIAASRIPVISAVGHEVDQTLADLVADLRAATPSNAGEIAVPDRAELASRVRSLSERARRAVRENVSRRARRFEALLEKYGFRRHRELLGRIQQRVDERAATLRSWARVALQRARRQLDAARARYGLRSLRRNLAERRVDAGRLSVDLAAVLRDGLEARRLQHLALAGRLQALSPRRVLERGYCLVRRADGTLARVATDVAAGDRVAIEFSRGQADARIEKVREP